MKKLIKSLMIILTFSVFISCADNACVTCIAQNENKDIVDFRSACDKDSDFRNGFVDGFTTKNEEEGNTVTCNFYTDER